MDGSPISGTLEAPASRLPRGAWYYARDSHVITYLANRTLSARSFPILAVTQGNPGVVLAICRVLIAAKLRYLTI